MIETVDTPDVFGHTIFCDDIRFEADGKMSFIGSYGGAMTVHAAFPAALPKFGFAVTLWQAVQVARKDFVVKIFLPGDDEEKAPPIEMRGDPNAIPDPGPEAKFLVASMQFLSAPLVLKSPGVIRSRALIDGKLYRLGSLSVSQGPIPTASKPTIDGSNPEAPKSGPVS